MNLIKKILISLMMFTFIIAQEISIEEQTRSGDELRIKLKKLKGNITIKGWDKSMVGVTGEIDDDEQEIKLKKTGNGFSLMVRFIGGYYDDDHLKANLTINVPKKYDVTMETMTELTMMDVEGEFDISIANDDAMFNNLKGTGDISVVNGKMTIKDSQLDGGFSNVNGNMKATNSDMNGKIQTTNANMKLSRSSKGVRVRSTNGNISFESVSNFIKARTTNGNLDVGMLKGSLDFDSTNGAVEFEIGDNNSYPIDVSTLNGSVIMRISDQASYNFDIRIEEQNSYQRKNYKVKSDFKEIDIKYSGMEDDEDYEVTARGSINGGKEKAYLRIINGHVTIKKKN